MAEYVVLEYPTHVPQCFHRDFETEKAAMQHVKRRLASKDGRLGEINIIKVMKMDNTLMFEWTHEKGITFPDAAELAKNATED